MMRSLAFVTVLASGAFLAAGLAPSRTRTIEVSAAPSAWKIDTVHSSLIFRIKHFDTAFFYGRFNDINGEITWDDADPTRGSFNIEIRTASVDTKAANRDRHLRSSDFFNAEQFPVCSFKSTSIAGKDGHAYELKGDLTINGVTRPVTVVIEKTGQGKGQGGVDLIGFETVFTINRSDFGVNYMPGGLGEEVKVFCALEAQKR